MASKHLPKTSVKISCRAFEALVNVMGNPLEDTASMATDLQSRLVIGINIGIYREWLAMTERLEARKNYKCTLDIAQAIAFVQFWRDRSMPPYEGNTLNAVIGSLDRSLSNQYFKKMIL